MVAKSVVHDNAHGDYRHGLVLQKTKYRRSHHTKIQIKSGKRNFFNYFEQTLIFWVVG